MRSEGSSPFAPTRYCRVYLFVKVLKMDTMLLKLNNVSGYLVVNSDSVRGHAFAVTADGQMIESGISYSRPVPFGTLGRGTIAIIAANLVDEDTDIRLLHSEPWEIDDEAKSVSEELVGTIRKKIEDL